MSELEHDAGGDPVYAADAARPLHDRLRNGDVPIAVYGLDRTALSLAATLAATSGRVVAADTDETLVETVDDGECPYETSGGLNALVADTTAAGDLVATDSLAHAAERAQVHLVRLSTPMDDEPDLSALRETLTAVAGGLAAGDVVVVESTVPVGTSHQELYPLLVEESDLAPGAFGFAFTPERPPRSGLRGLDGEHTRVVAGVDGESEEIAATLFETLTGGTVTTVPDLETAEMTTLVAATYRTVAMALSNELARHASALDVDVAGVIDAVNQRGDCALPPPSLGSTTCHSPDYLKMLRDGLETDTRLLDAARVSMDLMPTYAVIALFDAFERVGLAPADATVLVVGTGQRTGLGADQDPPSLQFSRLLTEDAVTVDVTGRPPIRDAPYDAVGASVIDVETALDRNYDAVVLAAPTIDPPDGRTMASLATDDHDLVLLDGFQLVPELRTDDSIIYRGIGINA